MFTGIVQGTAEMIAIQEKNDFRTHRLRFPQTALAGLQPGASIAHNGCCLTVSKIDGELVDFDLMQETLKITNLGLLKVGDSVNFERAARYGDEIGGHAMSGHILCTAEVVTLITTENNHQLRFRLPNQWQKYLFTKGYIGIDGISLTIGHVDENEFEVNLIPETLQRTNLPLAQQSRRAILERH
ncbi:MAG: riboflavin synthase subunit alpha [Candidatus Thiodiazotropha sp.]